MRVCPLFLAVAISLLGCASKDGNVDGFARERERQSAWVAQQEAARSRGESARREAEKDHRRAAEEAESRRHEEEGWAAQRPLACASGESEPACEGLRSFLVTSPLSAHAAEARAALDSRGRLEIQRLETRYRVERAAREKADQETATTPSSTSTTPSTTIAPPTPVTPTPRAIDGHVCCCDGTLSPTCTTVHRGCCSHHGGVCACE